MFESCRLKMAYNVEIFFLKSIVEISGTFVVAERVEYLEFHYRR